MNKYQSYKPSGVEWIGVIPEKWRISKFKYVSKLYTGNSLNDEQKILYESDDENHVPYVSSKDIDLNTRSVNYNNGLRIPKENNPLKVSPKDSFLLCVEGGSSGRKMVYLDREVCFVNKLCSFKSIENTRFQYYFIQSSNFQDKFRLSLSGLIGGVSISTLRDFELVLPSIEEQYQIVQYLDEKSELIDNLISIKERKITLLREQRTSLINQVVTKGLNPNVKMKDSGVEWIGEIPENWNVFKMKYGVNHINEKGITLKDDVKISPENVESMSGVCFNYYSEYEGEGMKFKNGDVLLNKLRLYLKKIVFTEIDGFSMGEMIVLRCNEHLFNRYFYYLIFHQGLIDLLDSQSNGVKLPRVSPEIILNSLISFPPIKEQVEIVNYLDSKTKEIDNLVQLDQKKIDLLKEYRKSLISEVVTGKIKVTND